MAVSGITSYKDSLYYWQGQQLKNSGSSSSAGSTSSMINSLFGGSKSTISQINSMVELTKYAMEQMGVASDSRVTFSQITKYREQLQSEFEASVKKGIAASGISDLTALSFEIDKNGAITAIGDNADDRKAAQAWLDANPSYGKSILNSLPEGAFAENSAIGFTLSSTGKMTVKNAQQQKVQESLNKKGDLADNSRNSLESLGFAVEYPLQFVFDGDGNLTLDGNDERTQAMNQWLKGNSEIADEVKAALDKQGIHTSAVSLSLGKEGAFQVIVNNQADNEIQAGFDKSADTGKQLQAGLSGLNIDKNINFSIQIDENGALKVISDHPDAAKLQHFFDNNPELVKKYKQIEALTGVDDARKAMQISPTEMRKRIQVESMAAWWSSSSDSSSYFGQYSGSDGLSLLSGLNIKV